MNVLHENINYTTRKLHQNLISALESNNVKNIVFAPTYNLNHTIIKVRHNEIVRECFKKNDRYFFSLKQHKIYKSLLKNVDLTKVDIIHGHTLFSDGNIAYKVKQDFDIPYIVTIRNQDIYSFFKKLFFLRKRGIDILLNAEAIVCLSESYKKTLLDNYVPNEHRLEISSKIHIIPNGIDEFWFNNSIEHSRKLNNQNKIKLLFVGEVNKNKNIMTTIKAMDKLAKSGIKSELTIVGPIRDEKYYNIVMNNRNISYHTSVPKEKLINYYRQNDIFIMPSIHESFGLVYAEAMSQGLPVIYSKNQGFDNHFKNGLVGYSVNPLDYKEISERILNISVNYTSISRNCINLFNKFNWGEIGNSHKSIYKTALRNHYKISINGD